MSSPPPRLWPWILVPAVALVAVVTFAIVGVLTAGAEGTAPWPWWGFFPWFPFVGIWIFLGLRFLLGFFRWGASPWARGYGWDRDDSRAILRERYARGEITREQFDRIRRDLDEHGMHHAYEDEATRAAGP